MKDEKRLKRISFNEKFTLVVDLFYIDYYGGEESLYEFREQLRSTNICFNYTHISGGNRYKFRINISEYPVIDKILNSL